jgi:glycerophosphoryl diester phosphodiesterase
MNFDINKTENNSSATVVEFSIREKQNFQLEKLETQTNENTDKAFYLSYPGVDKLISDCKKFLEKDLEIVFDIGQALPETNFEHKNLFSENKTPFDQTQQTSGISANPFGSLLTSGYAGQKILGSFSLAYIEARAMKEALEKDSQIDHFTIPEGICHLSVLDEAIRAFDFLKYEIVVMLVPENSIKAFRRTRFSGWQLVETNSKEASIGKVTLHHPDQKTDEITLTETEITNLDSPIYKVKIGERWVLVATQKNDFLNIGKKIKLKINNSIIDSLKNNNTIEQGSGRQERTIEASPGQAIRTVFALLGNDIDLVPEALLNFEGGSWSSLATEKASSGRHCGTNSMHEVLKHQWYKHPEVAIPWNYLGFDFYQDLETITPDSFILSFQDAPHIKIIESPQYWKKIQQELLVFVSRFVYREYATYGSKKFLLSTKDLIQITTRYLAELIKHNLEIKSEAFVQAIASLNIPSDLKEFLKMIGYLHLMNSSKSDFYSSKNHPKSLNRINNLAQIEKCLEKLCPASVNSFKTKIKSILSKDPDTENGSLIDIYKKITG